jgi:hypothetical protein
MARRQNPFEGADSFDFNIFEFSDRVGRNGTLPVLTMYCLNKLREDITN